MWFVWEMKFDGTYSPSIYHSDKPGKKTAGSHKLKRKRLRELTGDDCQLTLDQLSQKYPLINEVENVSV